MKMTYTKSEISSSWAGKIALGLQLQNWIVI